MFAIKARVARTHDIHDIRLLAGIAGLNSAEEALQIYATSARTTRSLDRLLYSLSFRRGRHREIDGYRDPEGGQDAVTPAGELTSRCRSA
jgi:hypothetical protein